MANLVQKAVSNIKAKASQLLNNLDRDKSMSGFQLAQGGLGNKISQGIQSWQAKPSNQMWNSFANNTPQVGQAFTNWANKTYSPTSSPSLMNPLGKYNPLNSVNRAVVGFTGNQIIQPALDIPKNINIAKDPTKGKLERGLAGLQAVGGALPGVDDAVVMSFLAAQNKLAGGSLEKGFTGEEFTGTGTLLAKNTALETPLNFAGLLAPALAGKLKPKQLDEVLAAGKKVGTPKLSVEPTKSIDKVSQSASKYGWTAKQGEKGIELFNRNGKKVVDLKEKSGGRYEFTYPDGEKVMSGYGQIGESTERLIRDAFYGKPEPTKLINVDQPSKPLSVEPVGGKDLSYQGTGKGSIRRPTNYGFDASGVSDKAIAESGGNITDNVKNILKKIKGNPEAEVTIYRGAPKGAGINEGDWIALDRSVAEEFTRSRFGKPLPGYEVQELKVKAKDILPQKSAGKDKIYDFSYSPSPLVGKVEPVGGKKVYHATSKQFDNFDISKAKTDMGGAKAIFFSETPEGTKYYQRGENSRVIETNISPEAKIFDYQNPEHTALLENFIQESSKNKPEWGDSLRRLIKSGDWGTIEGKDIQGVIKKLGFDGFYDMDMTGHRAIGITNPKVISPSKPLSVEPVGGKVEAPVKLKAKNLTNDQQLLLAERPDVKLLPGGTVYVKNASQAKKQLKAKMPGVKVEVYNPLTPGTKPLIPYTDTPFIVKDGAMAQKIRAKFPTAKIIVDNKLPGNAETIMMAPPAGSLKMTTLADVEQMLGLEATGMKQVGTEGIGGIGGFMRGVEDKLATTLGRATTSESPFIRAIANGLRGFSGGLTKTQEYLGQMAQFKGGQDYSNYLLSQLRQQTKDSGMKMTDLENIWKSLDPELAGVKASDVVLTPKQKEFSDGLRVVSDYINDLNYQNGFISQDNWLKNRGGKYIARAYETYDMPDEIVKGIEATNRKLNLDGFMKRLGITEWKQKEAIKDPVYLVSKRLQETMFNDATSKFFKWVRNQPDLVSDNPGPGFVKISDHKAYGDLAGKFVRKDVLEDIRGLFSTNDTTQKIMDLLNTWDRLPPRQWRKKILTVWNPATRLGNATGNYVFSMMSGIDPVTFTANKMWAKNAIKNNDVIYRQMIRDGVVGVDAGRGDIVQFAKEVSNGVDDGLLKRTDDYLKKTYSQTDEIAKVAAMKTWLDKGLSYEEAAKRVSEGFQNYRTTGWLYDIAAKTPIFGNAFIRFAPEFIRIAKNSATRHPVAAISMLSAWIMMERMGSMMSGETAEDRQTRITRPGAARLPFTNIPLSIMIGDNEVNVSRFVGMYSNVPFSGTSEIGSNLARISPFLMPEKKNLSSDVAFGPLIAAAIDTDFRGKSIQDPNATKYMPSTLTPEEKRANVLKYLAYQYAQPASQLSDVAAAFKGEPDFYGRTKTPVQALLRTYPGVKVEKFGPEQAAEQRAKTAEFQESANDQIRKQITSVKKQLLTKKIDQETADKRIQYLQGQIKTTTPISGKGTFDYIRESDGSIQSIDTTSVSKLPESTGYEKAIKEQKAYSLAKEIINNLPKEQQAEALASIGIDEVSAIKYTIGSQDNDIKTAYVTDQIPLIESQAKTRNDFLVKLAEMREEVGGKMILANGVIDNLVDEGMLTYNEGRMLKKLEIGKTPTGKKARVKVSGRGTGAKLKVSLTPISKLLKTTRSKPKRFAISKERAKKIML